MTRYKATGYTEHSPIYQPPLPPVEPDYLPFKFRPVFDLQRRKINAERLGGAGATRNFGAQTADVVGRLLAGPLISSPFVRTELRFEAPHPQEAESTDGLPETIRINRDYYEEAKRRWNAEYQQFEAEKEVEDRIFRKLQTAWNARRPEAIRCVVGLALKSSNGPWASTLGHRVHCDISKGILLVMYGLPDVRRLCFAVDGPGGSQTFENWHRRNLEDRLVHNVAVRLLFDLATLLEGTRVERIAVNGHVTFIDPKGHRRKETILSIVAKRRDVVSLEIDRLDPKDAFRALEGRMTTDLSEYSPVTPLVAVRKVQKPTA